jgi:hypothetical protein
MRYNFLEIYGAILLTVLTGISVFNFLRGF